MPDEGPMQLSDFGEARIGPGPYEYQAMPQSFRAPEIMLEVPWSYPIDVWSVGLTVCDLAVSPLERRAFSTRALIGLSIGM